MKVFYAKYPLSISGKQKFGVQFFRVHEEKDNGEFLTIFPKHDGYDAKENCIYSKENKHNIFCKSIEKADIRFLRGGLVIEKCTTEQRRTVAREWYFTSDLKLPRKIKKRLIGKCKSYVQSNNETINRSLPKPSVPRLKKMFPASGKIVDQLKARDGNKCLRCGSMDDLTKDHVIPKSKGGKGHISNYQLLCGKCNVLKADQHIDYRVKA